jgi:GDP/UDP-N,N'-diacetylbacillosamine 2-epimerase (hydrolysing)
LSVRKLLFVTGSRGEYGYIRPILRRLQGDPDLLFEIAATGMHLLPEFGNTIHEIERDGFPVTYRPTGTLAGYTPATMMKSMCVLGLALVDIFDQARPDFVVLAGDRGEQLISAITAAHLNIPVAHIQAGELSGNIDGQSRHAIARFAHVHFAANEDAAQRLVQSGEQEFRVFNVGAPQLDDFLEGRVLDRTRVYERYRIEPSRPFILLIYHSVTEEFELARQQMEGALSAVGATGLDTVVIFPNSDAGSMMIRESIARFQNPRLHVFRSVPREDYAGLMAAASVLVGNSSSGLLEAPSFELPVVNIGRRQKGRVRGENVIDCGYEASAIRTAVERALSCEFRRTLAGMRNPYGDGRSSERIIEILKAIRVDEKLLKKEMTY